MKKGIKITLIILGVVILLFLAIFINHQIRLKKEAKLLTPIGQLVEVDGHKMNIYIEGEGEQTIVFLSGGGTCSPVLDFKSLYSLLSDDYKVVVVEKFGYGFSDVVDKERDVVSVLADTRAALAAAGVEGPYILCPHSMSGIEALYWAQQYPEEVSAIVGLDMAVPGAYEDYKMNMPMLKLSQFAARVGIIRLLPGVAESEAMKYGTLTEEEKETYKAVFFSRTATTTMMNEVGSIKESAKVVDDAGVPQVPMLLFVSNGSGTGWEEEAWRNYQKDYIQEVSNGRLVELNCSHYVHDHEYVLIAEEMSDFISSSL